MTKYNIERLGKILQLDELDEMSGKPPRRRRRLPGRMRNWAMAAGLACLGSFLPASAADSIGVWGGGGGGAGSSSPYGGGGGAGSIEWGGVKYSGNGGIASPGNSPVPGTNGEDGWNKSTPSGSGITTVSIGDGGAGQVNPGATAEDGGVSNLTASGTYEVSGIQVYGGGAGGSRDAYMAGGGGGAGGYEGGKDESLTNAGGTEHGDSGQSSSNGFSAMGGGGGNATLTLGGEVILHGDLIVSSGESADVVDGNAGAVGGDATISVEKLTTAGSGTRTFSFTRRGGNVSASIDSLVITSADVSVTLDGSRAADVIIGDIEFGESRSLTVTRQNGGSMTAGGNITVLGRGAVLNLGGGGEKYDASNKSLHFVLPHDYSVGEALFTVTDGVIDVTNATVSVQLDAKTTNLAKGDVITLIDGSGTGVSGSIAPESNTITTTGLGTNHLTLAVSSTSAQLSAQVLRISGSGVGAALVEGSAAARAGLLYNRASAMTGYIHSLSLKPDCEPAGWTTFATVGGFDEKLDTRHALDIRGVTFAVGGVKYWNLGLGRAFSGIAAESGRGNYTSRITVDGDRYRGDGHADFIGGTLFGRLELPGLVGFDASFSMGRVGSDFRSAEYEGREAFDGHTTYFSGHLGIDKTFAFNPLNSMTIFSRLIHTRQNSDSFTTIADEKVSLDAFNSTLGSVGARYERQLAPLVKMYAGAAWEYEVDGKAKARIDGERLDGLSRLRGHSGMGELGLSLRSRECGGFEADISVRGRIGKHRGVSGNVTVGYSF